MVYYAIIHETEKVIASAENFHECSDRAIETKVWDLAPGTAAPYYITTIPPRECSVCGGKKKISDGYENFTCGHCE